jgi:hypothetical protein
VTFDIATNFIGTVDCALALDTTLLGPNTICFWGLNAQGASELSLSNSANDWLLMVGDSLEFLPNAVFSANGLSAPLGGARKPPAAAAIARRLLQRVEVSPESVVQPPLNPAVPTPPVVAILVAPANVSSCGELILDVSSSTGDAGRAFRTEWILKSAERTDTKNPLDPATVAEVLI